MPPKYKTILSPRYVLGTATLSGGEHNDWTDSTSIATISANGLQRLGEGTWDWRRRGELTQFGQVPRTTRQEWMGLFLLDRLRELSDAHSLGVSVPNLIDTRLLVSEPPIKS